MTDVAATARILVVDDNLNALKAIEYVLDREGFEVDCAASGTIALEMLRKNAYDTVVSDVKMPGMTGLELLASLRESHPELPVILLTAHGSIGNAVEAVKQGAWDYLLKPFETPELVIKIRKALERQSLSQEVRRLKDKVAERKSIDAIVGNSPTMLRIADQIRNLASKDISVIIYGESGTGKELAARALHQGSSRAERSFVAINCAAIPETLLENELFGHVKGAYTGANATHKGLFEEAHGGTIFLDEIGDIPASIQAKLLRVLQEQEFKKVGGTRDVKVDVRVLTATNKDLRAAVAAGKFREDLYYRINVVPLWLPPLRERTEDIPLLANYFRNQFNDELKLALKGFSDEAIAAMVHYGWPGNVRELRNRVKMAMVMARTAQIGPEDLALGETKPASPLPSFREARESFEREYVLKALKMCGGNVKKAAQLAGRDRSTFYDLLKKHELSADPYRGAF